MTAQCQTANAHPITAVAPAPQRVPLTLRLARALDRILEWNERAHQRRQLAGLPNHMLEDLGLSRADVDAEVGKTFWTA